MYIVVYISWIFYDILGIFFWWDGYTGTSQHGSKRWLMGSPRTKIRCPEMYDPGRCRFLAEQPLGFVKVEETGSRRGGFCSFLKWWYATRSTQGRPNTASDGLAGVAHTGSSSVVRRGLPLDRLEDVDLTYWCLAGNGWEWGNGIIINNYI